ncbi:MAG: 30S ribosomal protein S9 [Pirellulaceae bacterium]|nr:30S ribosomal protein S9 [Pirellulaceae bacterium]
MIVAKKDRHTEELLGTGRRKSSVARVRVKEGAGLLTINGRSLEEYFPNERDRGVVLGPLNSVEALSKIDVRINVIGGGTSGQAGACSLGIARALCGLDEEYFATLRDGGYLTRDPRMKERKKPGLHGARRGTQFSKR